MDSLQSIKETLFQEIDYLALQPDLYCVHPGVDFTRKRKIGLSDLIRMIVLMGSSTLGFELYDYFGDGEDLPSASAFCQQRQKLDANVFFELMRLFNSHINKRLYLDKYQLIAVDGTELTMQRNPRQPVTFSKKSNGHSENGYSSTYATAFYDLENDIYLDTVTQPGPEKNEHKAFKELIVRFTGSQELIILADMGFASYNAFAHLQERGFKYFIRIKDSFAKGMLGLDELPEQVDENLSLIISHGRSEKKRLQPSRSPRDYRYVPKRRTFDYITDDSAEYELNIRIVRFSLKENTYENIATNLSQEEFDLLAIKNLYSRRWSEETSFRQLKHTIGLAALHCSTYKGVCQEIGGRMVLYNVSSAIRHLADKLYPKTDQATKYTYKTNTAYAIRLAHDYLRSKEMSPPENLLGLIAHNRCPIRPGRHYPRHHRGWCPGKQSYRSLLFIENKQHAYLS